jgi:hypothetical protein
MTRFTTITIAALSLSVVICSPALAERPSVNMLNAEVNQLQADVGQLQAENECRAARYQLVGYTSDSLTSDTGVLAFTLACRVEFTDSRMCSSLEVIETTSVPSGLIGVAWVRPSFSPVSVGGGSGTSAVELDASGVMRGGSVVSAGLLSCSGWSQSQTSGGLTVDSNGRFVVQACSDAVGHSVACCALIP